MALQAFQSCPPDMVSGTNPRNTTFCCQTESNPFFVGVPDRGSIYEVSLVINPLLLSSFPHPYNL